MSSDMWCCVTGQVFPSVSRDGSAFIPPMNEGDGTMIPQNVRNHSPKYTPSHLWRPKSCEDVKTCTDMRCSQQSAVIWHHRYCRSLPVSMPVYQTVLWHIPNYHTLWMLWCWIHTAHLPELCIQHKRHKHKLYIFLVSVTGMCLNQLKTIVNALWNISHTTLWACEVLFVSQCTNLVLWILHFGTASDMCTDGHKMIWYICIFNRNWVDTRWRQYSTHLHTNNTQNTEKVTYITIKKLNIHNNKKIN
jgi:hypothetical protein